MTHWVEAYLGKPWVSGEAGPDAYDCYGLVRAVYRDRYGIVLPIVDVDATKLLAGARAMRDYSDYGDWELVKMPVEGDVLECGHARHPHHVGVWVDTDGGRLLHSVEGSGVLAQTASSLKLHGWNIIRIYRRRT